MSDLLMKCPYGHTAKAINVKRKRYDYNRDNQYVQCDECKRVFVHEQTMVKHTSRYVENGDVVVAQSMFDDGWHEENGMWSGEQILFGYSKDAE